MRYSAPVSALLCLLFCTSALAAVTFTITPTSVYNNTLVTVKSSEAYFGDAPVNTTYIPFACNFISATNATATYVSNTTVQCRSPVLPWGYSNVSVIKYADTNGTVAEETMINATLEYMPPANVPCATTTDVCTQNSFYNTTSHSCPAPSLPKPSTTVCRPSTGDCDAIEYCTGSSLICPNDTRRVNTTVCRAATGQCDLTEFCNGVDVYCPTDLVASSHTICRDAQNGTNPTGYCDGYNKICPFSQTVPTHDEEAQMVSLQQSIISKIDKNNHETNAKLIAVIALLGTCVLVLIFAVAVLVFYVRRLMKNMPKPYSDDYVMQEKPQQQQQPQPQPQQRREIPMQNMNVQVATKRTSNPPQQKRDGKVYKKINV